MAFVQPSRQLTHEGAMAMVQAAITAATDMGQPQCIVIVDASGALVAELRMTGAKFLSQKSARSKAMTAAATGAATETIPEAARAALGMATGGSVTALPGGMPIRVDGMLIGGIGIGSGTGAQDILVAKAALAAIGAEV
ncbi:MAG: hypothetical protein ACJA1E_000629 [Paracoccaceae bacterium]|jgi:uncharacterized protein GlcG (DUF336 family)